MKGFNAKKAAPALTLRINPFNVYTSQQVTNILEECGLPTGYSYRAGYVSAGILVHVTRSTYKFKSPITSQELEHAREYVYGYTTPVTKKKVKKITNNIEEAISLLKKNGYLILKQI